MNRALIGIFYQYVSVETLHQTLYKKCIATVSVLKTDQSHEDFAEFFNCNPFKFKHPGDTFFSLLKLLLV